MTENEFVILDELYFVIPFSQLQKTLQIPQSALRDELRKLIEKEWVKILDERGERELDYQAAIFDRNFDSYYYLATKKGLFEHNSQ